MPIKADDFLAGLPESERTAIEEQARLLIAEESTLRQLRKARKHSQKELAEKLNVNQAAVSKLESRADMYLSTLRGYVEAMGGELEIVARFPNQVVRIDQFKALGRGQDRGASVARKRPRRRREGPEAS